MTDKDENGAEKADSAHAEHTDPVAAPSAEAGASAHDGSDRDSDPTAGDAVGDDAGHAAVAYADGHADAHDGSHGHGLAHVMPVRLLVGVLAALLVLTILTVSVTHYDLGSEGNLVVALVIATVKAGLVVTFFMHLAWDRRFNLLAFLSAVLFLILFLSLAVTDRSEYQPQVDQYLQQQSKTQ